MKFKKRKKILENILSLNKNKDKFEDAIFSIEEKDKNFYSYIDKKSNFRSKNIPEVYELKNIINDMEDDTVSVDEVSEEKDLYSPMFFEDTYGKKAIEVNVKGELIRFGLILNNYHDYRQVIFEKMKAVYKDDDVEDYEDIIEDENRKWIWAVSGVYFINSF